MVSSGWPEALTSANDPATTKPPFWFGAVAITGVLTTLPTNEPAGMPGPDTVRPTSVMTPSCRQMVELAIGAVADASVRGPGTLVPPPSRHVPLGRGGTVCATQLAGRSMKAL